MCTVAWLVWLNRSANTSSFWPCGSETLASSISGDCCHDISATNIHIAAWQQIMKPKAIELHVIVRTFTCYSKKIERSDQPGFMHKTFFSPFKPYLQLRENLLNNGVKSRLCESLPACYCSWLEEWQMHLSQKSKLPLLPFYNFLDPILSLSNIRALSNSTTPTPTCAMIWSCNN